MKKRSVRGLVLTGLIAGLYVVLTLPFGQIAFGPIQFRLAEVLTLLPFFTPWAIPGCTIGCLLSNLLFSTPLDVVVGTAATLIAAYLTYKCKWLLLAPLPPILANGLMIGGLLTYLSTGSFSWSVFALLGLSTVQAGERLSQKAARAVTDYYQADCAAEELFARLRAGEVPAGVTQEDDTYSYTCPISDTQQLCVTLQKQGGDWAVLRWQAESTVDWETDDGLELWDGT